MPYKGKSVFCEKAEYDKLGYEMPPYRLFDDLMQFAFGIPPQKLYFFDMPRAMKKDKMSDFFSGMEALKNGRMFDKRYTAKSRRIDRPNIILFTNVEPNLSYMSLDRWKFHTIINNHLEPYVFAAERGRRKNELIQTAQNHGVGHDTHTTTPDDDL